MRFQVTPMTCSEGQFYEIRMYVRKWNGWKLEGFLSEDGQIDWLGREFGVHNRERFIYIRDAVKFIKRHYGEQARICSWRPE